MKININSINKELGASLTASFNEKLSSVIIAGETLEFKNPVDVAAKVTNTGSNFIVSADINAQFELICSRCLNHFTYDINTNMLEDYCRSSDITEAEKDGLDINELIIFDGDFIDISQEVIDSIVMALPMKPICNDNCQGLCTVCGQNLNENKCNCQVDDIDPRLEVLKNLKF